MTNISPEETSLEDGLFLNYLRSISSDIRKKLLYQPACTLFIFRLLPSLAQQLIAKTIWNSNVCESLRDPANAAVNRQLELLRALDLVQKNATSTHISPTFRKSYLRAMMLGARKCSGIREGPEDLDHKKRAKRPEITKKAAERWECILKYLTMPSEENKRSVSPLTQELFESAGFTSQGQNEIEITSRGFQFLLLSPVHQMWTYVIEYLKLEENAGKDVCVLISLMIRIILCLEKYSEDGGERFFELDGDWSEIENGLVAHMRELGLLFIRKRKDGVFFLTPLLMNLSTASELEGNQNDRLSGNVVVETNFRLYAYTNSSLQLAILSTFTDMTYRFNDMCVGILTRESVRKALQVGITAAQIISFLRANTHPQCLATGGPFNCLPITVADQMRLWEDERKRLTFIPATLYSTFESEDKFQGLRDFSSDAEILLWADNQQKLVIVTEAGHEQVRSWSRQSNA